MSRPDEPTGARTPPSKDAAGPLVPIEPQPAPGVPARTGPEEREREATAQRNKDAFARLGKTVAAAGQSTAEATADAARTASDRAADAARTAADRTAAAAGTARERVEDATARAKAAADQPEPVGDGVVVAGPGEVPPGGSTTVLRPSGGRDDVPSADASSVAISPVGQPATTDRAAAAGAALQDGARAVGDRATAAGQQAAVTGRRAAEQGQAAAAVAGQEVAARARQAGDAAQQAGAAAQQAGAAALQQTRSAVGDAVATSRSAVRERTAAPIDVEGLAAEVERLPGVSRLSPDVAGRGRGLLPGQVAGAQVTDDTVTTRVVARQGVRLRDLADQVHDIATRYAEGRTTVVEITDLDATDPDTSGIDPDQRGTT